MKERTFETNDGRTWVVKGLKVYLVKDGERTLRYTAKNKKDLSTYIDQLEMRFI